MVDRLNSGRRRAREWSGGRFLGTMTAVEGDEVCWAVFWGLGTLPELRRTAEDGHKASIPLGIAASGRGGLRATTCTSTGRPSYPGSRFPSDIDESQKQGRSLKEEAVHCRSMRPSIPPRLTSQTSQLGCPVVNAKLPSAAEVHRPAITLRARNDYALFRCAAQFPTPRDGLLGDDRSPGHGAAR